MVGCMTGYTCSTISNWTYRKAKQIIIFIGFIIRLVICLGVLTLGYYICIYFNYPVEGTLICLALATCITQLALTKNIKSNVG